MWRYVFLAVVATVVAGERVSRVGNAIRRSSSGVDVPDTAFLTNDVLEEGVLFAFRAYFRSDKPVRFQIWRPTPDGSEGNFTLIWESRVVPSLVPDMEDVYIIAKFMNCVRVQEDDRLGLFFEESPGAVGYNFVDAGLRVFGKQFNSDTLGIGTTVRFESQMFPYDFSVAAYIDTDLSQYDLTAGGDEVRCPDGLLIPDVDTLDDLTPSPAVTGEPGATGEAGPQGEMGPQGPTGPDGAQGMTGATGPQGVMGATGVMGPSGPPGFPGNPGATGPSGPKGDQGPQGPPGALPTDLSPTSSVENFLSSIITTYIILAWLALITIVAIIVAIANCYNARRRAKPRSATKVVHGLFARADVEWMPENRRSNKGDPRAWTASVYNELATSSPNAARKGMTNEEQQSWANTLRSTDTAYTNDTFNQDPSSPIYSNVRDNPRRPAVMY